MRAKMRAHLLKPGASGADSPLFHLKQGPGGIVDIEFLVQYAALAWSGAHPVVSEYTDNIRILEALGREALLAPEDAALLTEAYKAYRSAVHQLALQKQEDLVDAAPFARWRAGVGRIWQALLGESPAEG